MEGIGWLIAQLAILHSGGGFIQLPLFLLGGGLIMAGVMEIIANA